VVPENVRERISRASLPLMTKLSNMPRAMPFFVLLALLVGGLLIGGPVGFVLMSLAAAFVGWVLYLSWPRLTGTERIMRLAVLMLAVAMAITRLSPDG
jgi:hypothetical protein